MTHTTATLMADGGGRGQKTHQTNFFAILDNNERDFAFRFVDVLLDDSKTKNEF